MLATLITSTPDAVLDLEHQACLQGLQHARRSRLFPFLDAIDEVLVVRTDVVDGSARADTRRQLAMVDPFVEHQYPAGAGTAEKLVR